MSSENAELYLSFVVESNDLIDEAEPLLLELGGGGPINDETINSIFRAFHTIKGAAGFLQLNNLARVTHQAESYLDNLRKHWVEFLPQNQELLLATCDFMKRTLQLVEHDFSDDAGAGEADALVARFSSTDKVPEKPIKTKKSPRKKSTKKAEEPEAAAPISLEITPEMRDSFVEDSYENIENMEQLLLGVIQNPKQREGLDEAYRLLHTFKGNCGLFSCNNLGRLAHQTETVLSALRQGGDQEFVENLRVILKITEVFRETLFAVKQNQDDTIAGEDGMLMLLEEIMSELQVAQSDTVDYPVTNAVDTPAPEQPKCANTVAEIASDISAKSEQVFADSRKNGQSVQSQYIRIDLDKVDKLVDWVGELSIAELMVMQTPRLKGKERQLFEQRGLELHRIVNEIQNLVLSLRMIPVAGTFNKMLRLVHDLGNKAHKKVQLVVRGEDTEIDKSVIELISDPLVHMIRNSIDHGLEAPEVRRELGKPETGTLVLEAKHESGEIWITLTDDGAGINREKVLARAMRQDLVSGDPATLSDEEVFGFIFLPGFSTAEQITDISGRGVGMDVVRQNIEKVKGRIEVRSQLGLGTSINLRIPLTMALIEGMIVETGPKLYIIPLLSIREFYQPEASDITVTPAGQEIVNLREELIPVVRLHRLFKVQPQVNELHKGILIVLDFHGKAAALFVDRIVGQQQAVIKAIPGYYSQTFGIAGFTIMGDGNVCPILDIACLFDNTR